MGDKRFDRAWSAWDQELAQGRSPLDVLRLTSTPSLVHLLAADAGRDRNLDRNVVATALLNRMSAVEVKAEDRARLDTLSPTIWDAIANAQGLLARARQRVEDSHVIAGASLAANTAIMSATTQVRGSVNAAPKDLPPHERAG